MFGRAQIVNKLLLHYNATHYRELPLRYSFILTLEYLQVGTPHCALAICCLAGLQLAANLLATWLLLVSWL